MEKNQIGENAGIIWRALNGKRMSWEELVKATGLQPLALASGIGWLAREDKVAVSYSGGIVYFEVYHECYY